MIEKLSEMENESRIWTGTPLLTLIPPFKLKQGHFRISLLEAFI